MVPKNTLEIPHYTTLNKYSLLYAPLTEVQINEFLESSEKLCLFMGKVSRIAYGIAFNISYGPYIFEIFDKDATKTRNRSIYTAGVRNEKGEFKALGRVHRTFESPLLSKWLTVWTGPNTVLWNPSTRFQRSWNEFYSWWFIQVLQRYNGTFWQRKDSKNHKINLYRFRPGKNIGTWPSTLIHDRSLWFMTVHFDLWPSTLILDRPLWFMTSI